ncbi:MAG: hypothetical protein ABIT37_17780 [Luteolibacter sp.]
MTASTSFSAFHQWLLADPDAATCACAITLHAGPSLPGVSMVGEITDYLNEYDDDGDGRWLSATSELIEKVAADSNYRQLLGIPENDPPGPDGFMKTLAALCRRGRVVFQAPDEAIGDLELEKAFHAGVGDTPGDFEGCHLILNPTLIDRKCMPHIIGDVFLEWLHGGYRRNSALHGME